MWRQTVRTCRLTPDTFNGNKRIWHESYSSHRPELPTLCYNARASDAVPWDSLENADHESRDVVFSKTFAKQAELEVWTYLRWDLNWKLTVPMDQSRLAASATLISPSGFFGQTTLQGGENRWQVWATAFASGFNVFDACLLSPVAGKEHRWHRCLVWVLIGNLGAKLSQETDYQLKSEPFHKLDDHTRSISGPAVQWAPITIIGAEDTLIIRLERTINKIFKHSPESRMHIDNSRGSKLLGFCMLYGQGFPLDM